MLVNRFRFVRPLFLAAWALAVFGGANAFVQTARADWPPAGGAYVGAGICASCSGSTWPPIRPATRLPRAMDMNQTPII